MITELTTSIMDRQNVLLIDQSWTYVKEHFEGLGSQKLRFWIHYSQNISLKFTEHVKLS